MKIRVHQHGAALVELQVVTLIALLPLMLGILQFALLLTGHHVLSYAASEAARAGSVDHARQTAMYGALAEGLGPLLTDLTAVDSQGLPAGNLLAARLRAQREVLEYAAIERMTPAAADYEDHGRDRDGRRVIPNDALEHRSNGTGRSSGRSLQQSNLLRIRVLYCHALVVPLIDRLLPPLLRLLDDDPENLRCYFAGRVPLRVATSAPMQSDAWE